MPRAKHTSLGGQVVEASLVSIGYDIADDAVSLVETASPRRRHRTILLQSAWNVLPWAEFRALQRNYPPRMRQRAFARRAVARHNLRRAQRVVCLTESVGRLLRDTTGIRASVAPVTVPIQDWREPILTGPRATISRIALVPGTVTWYKRPTLALDALVDCGLLPSIDQVLFCGRDDGSGCWQAVQAQARELDLLVERQVLERQHLYDLYRTADVTLIPSGLESLGFSLSEALLNAPRVLASGIGPHVEIAGRVDIEPEWITAESSSSSSVAGQTITREQATKEWEGVGVALGLTRCFES